MNRKMRGPSPTTSIIYSPEHVLGVGGFATVYRGEYEDTTAAVKVFPKEKLTGPMIASINKELTLQSQIDHPNVVKIYGYTVYENGDWAIAFELMECGTLKQAIKNRLINDQQKFDCICQISSALKYLHTQSPPIVHADLKPENIMLTRNNSGGFEFKLSDFGVSNTVGKSANTISTDATVSGVSFHYTSPESLNNGRMTPLSDMFAFGSVVYFIFNEIDPFANESVMQITKSMLIQNMPRPVPGRYKPLWYDEFMAGLWVFNPSNRWSSTTTVQFLEKVKNGTYEPRFDIISQQQQQQQQQRQQQLNMQTMFSVHNKKPQIVIPNISDNSNSQQISSTITGTSMGGISNNFSASNIGVLSSISASSSAMNGMNGGVMGSAHGFDGAYVSNFGHPQMSSMSTPMSATQMVANENDPPWVKELGLYKLQYTTNSNWDSIQIKEVDLTGTVTQSAFNTWCEFCKKILETRGGDTSVLRRVRKIWFIKGDLSDSLPLRVINLSKRMENPMLVSNFRNSELSLGGNKRTSQGPLEIKKREAIFNVYKKILEKSFKVQGAHNTGVILGYHGTRDFSTARSIASVGIMPAQKLDQGYFGVGCYTTSSIKYALEYAKYVNLGDSKGTRVKYVCCMLCCMGNTFPVIEAPVNHVTSDSLATIKPLAGTETDLKNTLLGKPIRPGFTSHFSVVRKYDPTKMSSWLPVNMGNHKRYGSVSPYNPSVLGEELRSDAYLEYVNNDSDLAPLCIFEIGDEELRQPKIIPDPQIMQAVPMSARTMMTPLSAINQSIPSANLNNMQIGFQGQNMTQTMTPQNQQVFSTFNTYGELLLDASRFCSPSELASYMKNERWVASMMERVAPSGRIPIHVAIAMPPPIQQPMNTFPSAPSIPDVPQAISGSTPASGSVSSTMPMPVLTNTTFSTNNTLTSSASTSSNNNTNNTNTSSNTTSSINMNPLQQNNVDVPVMNTVNLENTNNKINITTINPSSMTTIETKRNISVVQKIERINLNTTQEFPPLNTFEKAQSGKAPEEPPLLLEDYDVVETNGCSLFNQRKHLSEEIIKPVQMLICTIGPGKNNIVDEPSQHQTYTDILKNSLIGYPTIGGYRALPIYKMPHGSIFIVDEDSPDMSIKLYEEIMPLERWNTKSIPPLEGVLETESEDIRYYIQKLVKLLHTHLSNRNGCSEIEDSLETLETDESENTEEGEEEEETTKEQEIEKLKQTILNIKIKIETVFVLSVSKECISSVKDAKPMNRIFECLIKYIKVIEPTLDFMINNFINEETKLNIRGILEGMIDVIIKLALILSSLIGQCDNMLNTHSKNKVHNKLLSLGERIPNIQEYFINIIEKYGNMNITFEQEKEDAYPGKIGDVVTTQCLYCILAIMEINMKIQTFNKHLSETKGEKYDVSIDDASVLLLRSVLLPMMENVNIIHITQYWMILEYYSRFITLSDKEIIISITGFIENSLHHRDDLNNIVRTSLMLSILHHILVNSKAESANDPTKKIDDETLKRISEAILVVLEVYKRTDNTVLFNICSKIVHLLPKSVIRTGINFILWNSIPTMLGCEMEFTDEVGDMSFASNIGAAILLTDNHNTNIFIKSAEKMAQLKGAMKL